MTVVPMKTDHSVSRRTLLLAAGGAASVHPTPARAAQSTPRLTEVDVFPLDALHNHASCVVECPNGDLLVSWYRGSGERTADDVRILGSRLRRGARDWSAPFLLADTPGFPDCNPAMIIDPSRKLWLFWPLIIANQWHTALLMHQTSTRYQGGDPPRWTAPSPVLFKPAADFGSRVSAAVDDDLKHLNRFPGETRERVREYLELRRKNGGDKYFSRMGWMPRAHPYVHEGKRMIVPLYSDGYDFSIMAITDDWGATWRASTPLIGNGPVQPSIARKRDGGLTAYFRDNGTPPQRLLVSESGDGGLTWTPPRDSDVFNPGSGAEVITLRDGAWALINNDTERGRHRLAVSISTDEGKSWRWTRHLVNAPSPEGAASGGYPSLIETRDGMLHATYTYNPADKDVKPDAQGRRLRATIRHAAFNREWVMAGD